MPKLIKPKILLPLLSKQKNENIIRLARLFSSIQTVQVLGIISIPEGSDLSEGTKEAQDLREYFVGHFPGDNINIRTDVSVTHDPWQQIQTAVQVTYPSIDTVIFEWPHQIDAMRLDINQVLKNEFYDVVIAKGQFMKKYESILIPIRGGPNSIESLRLSLKLGGVFKSSITVERIFRSQKKADEVNRGFKPIQRVLDEIPDITIKKVVSSDVSGAILESACDHDIVFLGTGIPKSERTSIFGNITSQILNQCDADVIAIKTKGNAQPNTPAFTSQAISVLVDKWFAENTFDADEFSNIDYLIERKEALGLTISLALPTLNEEKTVGKVIKIAKTKFMDEKHLLDEIILVDSNSTDRTREIARSYGIPTYINDEVLSKYGARKGKGEVLWKSLYLTSGDIVFWVDTDIRNFNPKFIYGVVGPLLLKEKVKFVKGFYKRPIMGNNGSIQPGGGGRVTELTARPLLNLFFPQLSGVIQPLSGEYGGKREVLEKLTFTSGYGVEISLLIDMLELYKLKSIGQVNLDVRVHRNQPLQNLSRMSFAIIQTVLSKLEKRYQANFMEDINSTMN
ncbi:MAG: glucosyl-3-phosphoglycerate synthase, partial [Anaerolineaceae bacterium]|nr:glucosyl-3-phosphoglycerate synthase [Anaerolineaceae bacterium]